MKKSLLLFLLGFLFLASNVEAQTGFLTRTNCASITAPVANQTFCGQTTTTGGRTAGGMYVWSGSAWVNPSNLGGTGVGTVTSVGAVGTANQIAVSGSSPITSAGTFTFSIPTNPTLPGTTTGTFSGNLTGNVTGTASGNTTNAAPLTANLPVIGAGSNAIAVGTRTGNTTEYATSTGSHTSGNCAEWDANGNIVQSSGACGIAGSGYGTIQDEGSNLTARTTMNFTGAGVTAADDSGNSRTNITIPGGATLSQGTLAGRGGASGSGVYEEITLGTNLSFSGTTLNASGGSSGLSLVQCQTVTGATTTVTFNTGIAGDTDRFYQFQAEFKEGASALTFYVVRPNGQTTNLTSTYQNVNNGGSSSNTDTVWYLAGASSGDWGTGQMTIYAAKTIHSVSRKRSMRSFFQYFTGGTANNMLSSSGQWDETSTEITSFDVVATNSNGIGDGSQICLYKFAQSGMDWVLIGVIISMLGGKIRLRFLVARGNSL